MARTRDTGPYVWVTWASKLLAGEASCQWASWFKARHDGNSWTRMPSDFDQVGWLTAHTSLVDKISEDRRADDYTVLVEGQNSMTLRGRSATLAGKPDLVASKGDIVTVIDAKTGRASPAHSVQVMMYMYMLPRALPQYEGLTISGQVAYPDHVVDVPANAVNKEFVGRLREMVNRLASETPPRKAPSFSECRFCEITVADCPDRVDDQGSGHGTTEDF